jgi:hypothetical protein
MKRKEGEVSRGGNLKFDHRPTPTITDRIDTTDKILCLVPVKCGILIPAGLMYIMAIYSTNEPTCGDCRWNLNNQPVVCRYFNCLFYT